MVVKLDDIFDNVMNNEIFKDRSVLQIKYTPENIPHRDEEIRYIAKILAPILNGEKPSNLLIYGKTGTGKTLCTEYVSKQILKKTKELRVNVKIEYINCRLGKLDTSYRILAEIMKKMGVKIPTTGLPTMDIWGKFIDLIEEKKQLVILILDEIDQIIKMKKTKDKEEDNFLYTLSRKNQELKNSQISFIGISNEITFLDNIDSRTKSSLGEEEYIFKPYDALQLQDILSERCKLAFNEGVISSGIISKCSAYAAREHGDARRALNLLRIAAELSERDNKKTIEDEYIDLANKKIENDRVIEMVDSFPKQQKIVLYAIILLSKNKQNDKIEKFYTGNVYDTYQDLCKKTNTEILTQRRIGDILTELDTMGIINSTVISKGRYGRTKNITLGISPNITIKVENKLEEGLGV